ncbi:myoneurin-like isoform X10 [Pieris napi]|uniref:myoneurin-like isoform X10 n=1 Tax=Pieris napi TaxID=78633 RepID=UPI001FB936BA|nr:myoneurin-like isoform X10 [Pieris napi]
MEGKVWRPGPTVCRCCLSEGCYKDISTEYFWMGKKEVYADMLSDTFDLSIQYAPTGGPNSQSRLICEPCISRLRDATDFKRQIKECEQTFMEYLNPRTTVDIEIPVELPEKEVKTVTVKVEKPLSDDDDFGDTELLDDDDDDLDDEPLMNLASKVPKKESVDVTDLIDNAKAEKRKSTTKPKATPKKAKVKEAKPSVSKAKPEKKKKAETEDPVRKNAEIIMRHTTANPFRVNDRCVLCVYCQDLFEDPDEFRSHMSVEHHTFSSKVAFYNLPKSEFIKADITDLQCRVCSEKFTDIETVARHLNESHSERIEFNAKLGVMPYKLLKGALACTICFKPLPSVFHLNRHTITHFQTYVCHVCGKSYVATTGLLRHVRLKHQQYEITCRNCGKVFPNMEAKDKHHRTEKSCMLYTCTKCKERFQDHNARVKHMEAKHGLNKRTYRCDDCNMTFNSVSAYYAHFKVHHSNDYVVCKHCGQKFTSRWRLQRHLSKHNF